MKTVQRALLISMTAPGAFITYAAALGGGCSRNEEPLFDRGANKPTALSEDCHSTRLVSDFMRRVKHSATVTTGRHSTFMFSNS
jgi:hypothetical protein